MGLFFFFWGCFEAPPKRPEVRLVDTSSKVVTHKEDPVLDEITFERVLSSDPVEIEIDATRVSAELSVMFLESEAVEALKSGLDALLSGSVQIIAQAPEKVGRDRPYIKIVLSKGQFLSLAAFQNNKLATQGLVQLFTALNAYKLYVANHGDLRVFHFDLAVAIGQCLIFPEHQNSHVEIKTLAPCGIYKEGDSHKEFCGVLNTQQLQFSDRSLYTCLKELP